MGQCLSCAGNRTPHQSLRDPPVTHEATDVVRNDPQTSTASFCHDADADADAVRGCSEHVTIPVDIPLPLPLEEPEGVTRIANSGDEARYNVWYRHSGQPPIDQMPHSRLLINRMKHMDVSEIRHDLGDHTITHMQIEGIVPDSLPDIAPDLVSLRLQGISYDGQQLARLADLKNLNDLDIGGNAFTPHTLPPVIYKLSRLRKLNMWQCGLSDLDVRLTELDNLEELIISHNTLSSHALTVIYKLRNLKILDMSECGLLELDDRLANLINLEELDIDGNKLSTQIMPSVICKLTKLRRLNIQNCGLKELSDILAEMVNLEELYISDNKFSSQAQLLSTISSLNQLRKLDISRCGLTTLDDMMAKLISLEELDIGGNNFYPENIPPVIYGLQNLQRLDMQNCGLGELDDRLLMLENLSHLCIGNDLLTIGTQNYFTELPKCILQMKNLKRLNLSGLERMSQLDPQLLSLAELRTINCNRCASLISPPYAVCKQGFGAIKKYYADLTKEHGTELPIVSIVVIGSQMAGKTSLIRSLIARKRVLSHRDPSAEHDDTTRVFEMNEIPICQYKINAFDFGGDKVYHIAYHLTIRENYIPIVVVNIEQFKRISLELGRTEAARQLCMDFISHLYLSCSRLGPPILVLTHRDALSENNFKACKTQLLAAVEMLRKSMLTQQKPDCRIIHFLSDLPMFASHDIFVFSGNLDEAINIQGLLQLLTQRTMKYITVIPCLWQLIEQFFRDNHNKPFMTVEEILVKFPGDDNLIILRYMHNIGRIFWFEQHEELKLYIFHRISVLTEILAVLFNHQSQQDWERRMNTTCGFSFKDTWISPEEYKSLVEEFHTSGILDNALLNHLYTTESHHVPYHLVITILQTFYMICGPVAKPPRDGYIIPYFATDLISLHALQKGNLRLQVDILFVGLSPPLYVYILLIVVFLNIHLHSGVTMKAAKNGAVVYQGNTTRYVRYDHLVRRLQLIIDTPVDELAPSWRALMDILDHMLDQLRSEHIKFDAAQYICEFYCAHCLYIGDSQPGKEIAPSWYTPPAGSANRPMTQRLRVNKVANVSCCKCTRAKPEIIPYLLRFPCFDMSSEENQRVRSYLSQLDSSISAALVDDIVTVVNRQYADIILEPTPATAGYTELDNQYRMTGTRGRALIISNKYEERDPAGNITHSRRGSKHDYKNMKMMLEKFGFVTSGDHKNYEAKGIVKAIYRETQLINLDTGESVHKELGMFVLVIMSHGDEGCVLGSDDRRVKLTDIYNMLSGENFPAMAGKPKLIIIQACSGGKSETTQPDLRPSSSNGGQTHITSSFTADNNTSVDTGPTHSVDDILIMQSSFDSFLSYRYDDKGSPFIRALVTAFYKHAHRYHVQELDRIIQAAVKKSGVGQVPISKCMFTGFRYLYLRPGLNMTTDHPPHIQNAVYPKAPLTPHTRIHWEPTKSVETTVTVWKTNPDGSTSSHAETTPVLYEQWSLRKVARGNHLPQA